MIRVFVGCAPNGEDAESQAVLEYTLRKHATLPVEITWMQLTGDRSSLWFSDGRGGGWVTNEWPTPFSGFRWAVPAACGFAGRAIYVDSDFIFLGDVAELWTQRFAPGKAVLRKAGPAHAWRTCISLWDCAAAERVLPPIAQIRADHRAAVKAFRAGGWAQDFTGNWNCLDGEGLALDDPAVKAIHYTDMSCQPQLRHALARLRREGRRHWFDGQVRPHPRADLQALFDKLLQDAQSNGYRVSTYIPAASFGAIAKRNLKTYRGHAHAV